MLVILVVISSNTSKLRVLSMTQYDLFQLVIIVAYYYNNIIIILAVIVCSTSKILKY